jgi:outer membrane autotransporter protein/uncharacterized repeat protein (TIGR01451 family)
VLATSATCVLTGSYTVTGADAIAGSVTNVGSVTSNEVPGPTTSSVVTPIAASANLAITKTDSPDPVLGGQSITYTIGVSNAGPQAAVSVAMSDVLAPQLGFVSLAAPAGWACGTPAVGASGAVNCTLANLPNGGSGTFTLVAKVAAGAGGSSVSNTATVSAATFDPSNADNSATATTAVTAVAPSMQVVKVLSGTVDNDSSGSVTTGDQLDYTVTATNNGNVPLSNVVVSDDHFAATQSCPTLAVNATCVLTGSYIVTAGDATAGTVTNVGSATSTQAAGPFTSSVTTPVGASTPSLAVVKVLSGTVDNDSSGSVTTGDQLDYAVTATNNGNVPLSNVVVSDDHFAATQSCPTLAVNATCVLTGSYIVTAGDATAGTVTNVGSATSTEVPSPAPSSVITPISTAPSTLAVGSGDGQSAPINTPFPDPLIVIAGGGSPGFAAKTSLAIAATPGVTIQWQVVSGSATVNPATSVTGATGEASTNVTAGNTAGPVVIRATRALDPTVTVDFHLTVTPPLPKLGDLPGLDDNQKQLADLLDDICSNNTSTGTGNGLDDLLARCDELIKAIATDPSGVIKALDELFGDIALVQSETSLLAAQSQFDNIKARIAALRSGTNGTSFGGLAFQNASGRMPIGTMFQSLLDEPQETKTKEVGSDFSRWGFFASGTIGRGNADEGSLSPKYDFDIDGLTVGADYRKSDKLIFGGTLGYTRQTNDLAGSRGSLDTTGWSASAYGTWYQQNSWYMDGVLSWGQNKYDVDRRVRYTITTPTGTTTIDNTGHASGNGDSLTFALSVGRDFEKGGWGFGPYLRAMYTKMDFDKMEEHFNQGPGNGLALELDTRSVTSLSSTLGGKLTYAHSTDWGVVIPHLQLEWQHEFKDDPAEVEGRFLYDPTGTPFTIHGDPVDTDFFRFGVGMSFVMTHGRSGFFYYERLISRDRFSQNSLALGIRLEF